MKPLALRAFLLLALVGLAHHVKPFTSTNFIMFAGASLRSLSELLPESAIRKASVLAAVVSRTWQPSETNAFAPSTLNLLATQKLTGSACACNAKRRVKTITKPVAAPRPPLAFEDEEVASASEPLNGEYSEEITAEQAAPLPSIESLRHAVAPAWSVAPKKEACEIPNSDETPAAPVISTPEEVAPVTTEEPVLPAPTLRSNGKPRTSNDELVNWQPIIFTHSTQPSFRLLLVPATFKRAQKSAAKC